MILEGDPKIGELYIIWKRYPYVGIYRGRNHKLNKFIKNIKEGNYRHPGASFVFEIKRYIRKPPMNPPNPHILFHSTTIQDSFEEITPALLGRLQYSLQDISKLYINKYEI